MSNDEFVKVVLKNTKDQPVAPMTTADQVIYDGGTIIDAFDEAYNEAFNAYNRANSAYCKACEAYDEATSAYNRASSAYSLASTNSEYLRDVKNIFSGLAGTMYNPGNEDSMGYIYGGELTVSEIKDKASEAYSLACDANNTACDAYSLASNANNIASAAYHIAGSIYNRESGEAAYGYEEGTYLLKATIDSNNHITFEWVNEADYKNVYNN